MPILRTIATGVRGFRNNYRTNTHTRAGTNTGLIYGGAKIVGAIGTATGIWGNDVDAAIDLTAPIVAAAYLNHRVNDAAFTGSEGVRSTIKVLTGAVVGADIADTLNDYQGNTAVLAQGRDAVQWGIDKTSDLVSRMRENYTHLTDWAVGGAAGAMTAAGLRVAQYIRQDDLAGRP